MARKFEILVIGGSAGSLKEIQQIFYNISGNCQLAIVVVIHRKSTLNNYLIEYLNTVSQLPVKEAEDKEKIKKGNIYIAPGDYHLLVELNGTFSLDFSEKLHFSRPSIDITFKSIADVYRENAVALLLSGASIDGADGIKTIKMNGGLTIVQSPKEAEVNVMPEAAIKQTNVDHILVVQNIIAFLNDIKY